MPGPISKVGITALAPTASSCPDFGTVKVAGHGTKSASAILCAIDRSVKKCWPRAFFALTSIYYLFFPLAKIAFFKI